MSETKLYAVITGDVVKSSKFKDDQRSNLLNALKGSFDAVKEILAHDVIYAPFEIHRGDEFQGVLSSPEFALLSAIIIRTNLRIGFETRRRKQALDARIVVGIGTINPLPGHRERGGEQDGEAFRHSGPVLDQMKKQKKDRRLLFRTPWPAFDKELDIECALLDALINRWSTEQAQAVLWRVRGFTQNRIASELGITQPAVGARLHDAGSSAIEAFLDRYNQQISKNISPGDYNARL